MQDGRYADLDTVPKVTWLDKREAEACRIAERGRRKALCDLLRIEYVTNMVEACKTRCANCWMKSGKKRCGECLLTEYCSEECAKLHWKEHKSVCKVSGAPSFAVCKVSGAPC